MEMKTTTWLTALGLSAACLLAVAPASAADCQNCGRVAAIKAVKVKGQSSGAGAVTGGVVGGVVGHQFGKGSGNTAMTVLGAAGGAYAGNEIEKNAKSHTVYKISVNMEYGETRQFTMNNPPDFAKGDRVRVQDGRPVFFSK
jgi:uncharacterized protein YcfJ